MKIEHNGILCKIIAIVAHKDGVHQVEIFDGEIRRVILARKEQMIEDYDGELRDWMNSHPES